MHTPLYRAVEVTTFLQDDFSIYHFRSKTTQLRTSGTASVRASVTALWGSKSLDNTVDLDLSFSFVKDKTALRRLQSATAEDEVDDQLEITVKGLVSKFSVGCGRAGTDRQFFFVNGRPCNLNKVQKLFNEVYRSFNATQSPFVVADFIMPTDACDVNVSPDKRTIFLHHEANFLASLRAALEKVFAPARSTFDVNAIQGATQTTLRGRYSQVKGMEGAFPAGDGDLGSEEEADGNGNNGSDEPESTHKPVSDNTNDDMLQPSGATFGSSSPGPVVTRSSSLKVSNISLDASTSSPRILSPARSPGPGSEEPTTPDPVEEPPIVLNTSRARWNKVVEVSAEKSRFEADHDDEPPRKKRRSEVTLIQGTCESSTSPSALLATSRRNVALQEQTIRTSRQEPSTSKLAQTRITDFARKATPDSDDDEGDDDDIEEDVYQGGSQRSQASAEVPMAHEELSVNVGDPLSEDVDSSHDLNVGRPSSPSPSIVETGKNKSRASTPEITTSASSGRENMIDITDDDIFEDDADIIMFDSDPLPSSSPSVISRPEVIRSPHSDTGDVRLRVDITRISELWRSQQGSRTEEGAEGEQMPAPRVPIDAGLANTDDEQAAQALSRVIDKQDFAAMEVVGQFNLGFIIARRRKQVDATSDGGTDDLFIVDQHAADEKYNFEQLQQTTRIKSQRLLQPQELQLTVADELVASENLDVLQQNGFEIASADVSPDDEDIGAEGRSYRLRLVAQPVSKGTVFDMKDLEEIIHLLRDRTRGEMVRCSKARAMFAMRACRKSVMVGMPLNVKQMTAVVQHMGTMDQPWNCPHGRPTMRHLSDLALLSRGRARSREIDWAGFRSD
ncbi:hypothetical protein HGRIS_011002 [Hohenbuehelia grisea]|uniref:Uncharacterized protein n=1 Tax=Hohenbuehelia grisea TaxID=104357 RepID=A0ABR3IYI2_9AGAR